MSAPNNEAVQRTLAAFAAFTQCLAEQGDHIGKCQASYAAFSSALNDQDVPLTKFFKPAVKAWEKKLEEADDDDDDDTPHVSLEKTELSNKLTDVLPQVFDGDAKREKTFLSKTLEQWMPRLFTEAENGDDDDD